MKHTDNIRNINQAKSYINALVQHGKDFHFDDDPREVIDYGTGERAFTDKEAEAVSKRVGELYQMQWGEYECPIGYLLHLRED